MIESIFEYIRFSYLDIAILLIFSDYLIFKILLAILSSYMAGLVHD